MIYNQLLFKKPLLNKEDLSSYRPNANLSFISKLTEKIVKNRLLDHLNSNSFASNTHHSTTVNISTHSHTSTALSLSRNEYISCLKPTFSLVLYFSAFPSFLAPASFNQSWLRTNTIKHLRISPSGVSFTGGYIKLCFTLLFFIKLSMFIMGGSFLFWSPSPSSHCTSKGIL